MLLVTRILLWTILAAVHVECQGGGGGGGGGGFIGLGGVLIFILILPIYCCYQCCAGKPSRSNIKFVGKYRINDIEKEVFDLKLFQSGIWDSEYFQYETWHGPHQFQLSFNLNSSTVQGSGVDDIGMFNIEGIYSSQTRRMGLTKKYIYGTGNLLENLGHNVIIQLEWNKFTNQFEGKWYVRTNKFKGSGHFKLKLNKQQDVSISSTHEKM